MGFVWVHVESFLHSVASSFHSFVSSYKRVKGRSHTVEKRKASHPQKLHATSQPSRFSHTPSFVSTLAWVAKMTQMRHDNLANALRLVVSACRCQSAAEPRYRALVGKKGMVECQRRGDIVAVLPRLELAAVDVVVAHASAKSYAAEAAKASGWTAARAERSKRTWFRKDVPDHAAFRFVPFAVETCGYMGKEAVKFVNRLGDIAAESGRIPKGAFLRWAMQLLSVTVQRGNAEMYRRPRSGLVISREQGLRYDAGFAVPVLMS